MQYRFSKPIQEGKKDGQPFYVVEIEEKHKGLVLRRTKISLSEAQRCLDYYLKDSYKENEA